MYYISRGKMSVLSCIELSCFFFWFFPFTGQSMRLCSMRVPTSSSSSSSRPMLCRIVRPPWSLPHCAGGGISERLVVSLLAQPRRILLAASRTFLPTSSPSPRHRLIPFLRDEEVHEVRDASVVRDAHAHHNPLQYMVSHPTKTTTNTDFTTWTSNTQTHITHTHTCTREGFCMVDTSDNETDGWDRLSIHVIALQ